MEPVTHLLTGACLARTGLHKRVAYATAAMTIAAEFPDIDTVWRVKGSVAAFAHHRGITHTFLGVPFEAGMLLAGFFLWDLWRSRKRPDAKSRASSPPVRWLALYGCLLLALLSHLLLDYTNNYGLRPFFPFNPRWYAASLVFIVDPWLLLVLVAGLVLPALFGLVGQEISGRRAGFARPVWAATALFLVVAYWGLRAVEHKKAMSLVWAQTLRAPNAAPSNIAETTGDPPPETTDIVPPAPPMQRSWLASERVWASPDPLSPFTWYTAADYGPVYQVGTADTSRQALATGQILYKPRITPTLRAAEGSGLGRVYLDWSAMPLLSSTTARQDTSGQLSPDKTLVTFEDLRFLNSSPLLNRGRFPPLSGQVILSGQGQVIAQGMDGIPDR